MLTNMPPVRSLSIKLASVPLLALTCALVPHGAVAQGPGGVARSGMGQGQARISTRSDVRMGIESGPATSGQRLSAMAGALTARMGEVRTCYERTTADNPSVAGSLRIRTMLPRRGPVRLAAVDDSVEHPPLTLCVLRALRGASWGGIERPANVFVKLDFNNTAAAGSQEASRRHDAAQAVRVERDAQGALVARGGTPGGEVTFEIKSRTASEASLAAAQRTVRGRIGGLLDCRRRAGRRGASPVGTATIRMRVLGGHPTLQTRQATLPNPECISRILTRARFPREATGRYGLTVHFSE
jgi:hypothetical protein